MDKMSWRAQLAKSNINILNLTWNDNNTIVDVFYEFMYRPYTGSIKWCKTWTQVVGDITDDDVQMPVSGEKLAGELKKETLNLRKELEN